MARKTLFGKTPAPLKRRSSAPILFTPLVSPSLVLARSLDRQADAELFHGHVAAAERLAHKAAQLRGWA